MHQSFNVLEFNILLHFSTLRRLSQDTAPTLSAFHDFGYHLSMFISDSLMTAFLNAKTFSSNALNE
jgi:hypothetical protein